MEEIRPVQKLVNVNNEKSYIVRITPVDDSSGRKTFKGIKVNMLHENWEHFAQDTFASTVSPGIIQTWIANMHNASKKVQNTMTAFSEWDGELNEYW
ncbi:hypothetical protein [Listeria immobilis]|uniref:hypothetical protein n=1 Tax=Listeria immobilis TaxID=2713502 RepID=UPI00164E91C4|nr:hypothetical protein [Listeria immobilis]MBC6312011.1 hypothetical protein [Listeria immobilis]